jgi:hypothetical protein
LPPARSTLDLRGRHLRATAFLFFVSPSANNTAEMWNPAAASSSRCGEMDQSNRYLSPNSSSQNRASFYSDPIPFHHTFHTFADAPQWLPLQ